MQGRNAAVGKPAQGSGRRVKVASGVAAHNRAWTKECGRKAEALKACNKSSFRDEMH